jgi:predicted RNase H-like HicB family nuclease
MQEEEGERMDKEIIFLVEEAPEGGYVARALGYSIFTEGDTLDAIREEIKDAVRCHFDENQIPHIVRLHFIKEEVVAI